MIFWICLLFLRWQEIFTLLQGKVSSSLTCTVRATFPASLKHISLYGIPRRDLAASPWKPPENANYIYLFALLTGQMCTDIIFLKDYFNFFMLRVFLEAKMLQKISGTCLKSSKYSPFCPVLSGIVHYPLLCPYKHQHHRTSSTSSAFPLCCMDSPPVSRLGVDPEEQRNRGGSSWLSSVHLRFPEGS